MQNTEMTGLEHSLTPFIAINFDLEEQWWVSPVRRQEQLRVAEVWKGSVRGTWGTSSAHITLHQLILHTVLSGIVEPITFL